MTRCTGCNRPLKAPDSIRLGMGPGCIKKAAKAGPDLFAQAREAAITALRAAAAECEALGVRLTLNIEGEA